MSLKFSIVTCTWNSAAFLKASIDSVLSQDYSNVEYIFVDGGSTDGTLEMIKSIPRPVVVLENVGGGISRAMNAGIAAATGDVVAHLHSDDYYAHEKVLSHVAEALEKSGARWCFGQCLSDVNGQRSTGNHALPTYSYQWLIKRNIIPHPATFVRKDLFDQVGDFNPAIKYAMDYDLWLRLGKVADPVQLHEPLAVFRWHPGSLTSSNQMASLRDDFDVRMRHVAPTPWSWARHWAYYLVRRRRLVRKLAGEACK